LRIRIRLLDPDVIWSQTMVIPWGAVAAAILGKPHVWYVTEFGERDHQLQFGSVNNHQRIFDHADSCLQRWNRHC